MRQSSQNRLILANSAGINLKQIHYDAALNQAHEIGFFEFHAENFIATEGPPRRWLHQIGEHYPLSLHGVCLSIGGPELDRAHLGQLKVLVDEYHPALVSEHLAWSAHHNRTNPEEVYFFNDLIAPPLTEESFIRIAHHVDQVQNVLGRQILIENPSSYIPIENQDISLVEPDFLNRLANKTGCGLLLDINNIYVSAHNLAFNPETYLDHIDATHVQEVHLAGYGVDHVEGCKLLIDNHGTKVSAEVWSLYERFVRANGNRATLIEWDSDVPPFAVFLEEVANVRAIQTRHQCPIENQNSNPLGACHE